MKISLFIILILLSSCQYRYYEVQGITTLSLKDNKDSTILSKTVTSRPMIVFNGLPKGAYYLTIGNLKDTVIVK